MRRLGQVLAAAATLAACGGADPPAGPDAGPDAAAYAFDLDVVADGSGVQLWLREHFTPACQPEEIFPHVGECAEYGDHYWCRADAPPSCLTRLAVERDGVVLGQADSFEDWWHVLGVPAPGLYDAPGATLVIEGCGGSASIPLPDRPPIAPPTIDDLATDGAQVMLEWQPGPKPEGVISTAAFGGVGAYACQDLGTGPGHVELPVHLSTPFDLYLQSVSAELQSQTPWGTASTWAVVRDNSGIT